MKFHTGNSWNNGMIQISLIKCFLPLSSVLLENLPWNEPKVPQNCYSTQVHIHQSQQQHAVSADGWKWSFTWKYLIHNLILFDFNAFMFGMFFFTVFFPSLIDNGINCERRGKSVLRGKIYLLTIIKNEAWKNERELFRSLWEVEKF